ncbi:DUF4811 domain-containing protein [Limosilactobacillus sp.]|jgi:hypothetical protein|uniref:DUF4811 domain-containing protein n=1 Tax=Limosilactobacillus sp. TaxID=2773925 RepID=UPI0025B9F7F7|nr:DUF4811 domain-containing protein [Limosilactobacillus sp.]MCH3921298.1 DUF4811 domain-containing protein [Limosilactobacillus sp.]MCH3928069.1 DUF4811 domain-containing protein [Limosilactobacillus sp.]
MVIIIMFAAAIAFFLSVMLVKNKGLSAVLALIFGILFVGSTALMTLNYSHHFGMHQVTTTTTKRIYPVSSTMPLALYQPVGTSGEDNVYIYKTSAQQKKPVHTQANEYTHSKIKWTNRSTPRLVTKETRWRYKNNFYRVLYGGAGMDKTLVKRINTLEYPRTYVKLTVKQAAKLQAVAKSPQVAQMQASAQQTGKAYVSAKVQQAMAKNPHMSAKQIQQTAQTAQQEFQAKMVRQMLKQLN